MSTTRIRRSRVDLWLSVRASLLVMLFGAYQGASAQGSTNSDGSAELRIEEVIVTAQRRQERLQEVPIAITALGEDEIAKHNIVDISNLRGVIPGLSISDFGGVNVSNLVAIRGISGQPLPIGAGHAVAMYLDGVYLSRPDAGFFSLDDVERIEVLRGPQGTLYGRNATAGAINIITRTPSDTVAGGLDVSYGDHSNLVARGSLSGPLADNLSVGISGSYEDRDGYFINTFDDERVNGRKSYTARGKLRYFIPGGGFEAVFAGDISRVDGADFFKNGVGDPRFIVTDIADQHVTDVDSSGGALTMNLDVNDSLVLTSVTSFRRVDTDTVYDSDVSTDPIRRSASFNESDTFTQELRGVFTNDAFLATFGFNYFREDAAFGISLVPLSLDISYSPVDDTELDAYAAFAQLEYGITDQLTLIGGLRYNDEQRDFTIDYRDFFVAPGVYIQDSLSDDAWIPSVGIKFAQSPDTMFYAKISNGYLAPGFNFLPGLFASEANVFGAEDLMAYELGTKTRFLDGQVTANIAAYYYDYQDLQVRSVTAPGVTYVDNAATSTVKGIEAEISFIILDGLIFSTSFNYNDAKYDEYCQVVSAGTPQGDDPSCGVNLADRSGNWLNQAPEWSGSVNVDYNVPISDAYEIHVNVGYSRESNVFYTTVNEAAASSDGGWERLDARVGVDLENGLEIYFYGRNLTDDRYAGQVFRLDPNRTLTAISAPRTYGAGIRYRF